MMFYSSSTPKLMAFLDKTGTDGIGICSFIGIFYSSKDSVLKLAVSRLILNELISLFPKVSLFIVKSGAGSYSILSMFG